MRLVIASDASSMWRWPADAAEALRARLPQIEIVLWDYAAHQEQAAAVLGEAEAMVSWRLKPEWLAVAPRLRWLHTPSAAVNQVLSPQLEASGIVVTNGASVHAEVVAEHALALLLALARGLPASVRRQRERRWAGFDQLLELGEVSGARVLLAGLGHIGRALALKLDALGARVAGIRAGSTDPVPGCAEVHRPQDLPVLLPEADYVVLALPATANTRAFLSEPEFARMPPRARIINVGRGSAIDEPALIAALRSGAIAGAALDVFAEEPLPPSSPLWDFEQVLITPHCAAATARTWKRQVDLIARHMTGLLNGGTPGPRVDLRRGY